MYTIISIRSKSTFVCPGEYAYDAEAKVYVSEEMHMYKQNQYVFVHVNWALGFTHYTISEISDYDFLTGETEETPEVSYVENYESLEEAQDSEFIDLFRMLDRILYDMFHGPKKTLKNQAKMLDLKTIEKADVDAETYYYQVIQSLEYENEIYEASFSIETDNKVSILLKKGTTVVEEFEDLEIAAYSEWFMLYCRLKKDLISFLNGLEKEKKIPSYFYAYIMSELSNDH